MESIYDWKKHASQVIADDDQVERAFMDQAYQFLNNKGGALMKDPYRLGFEIVHKNDSNTRMVGIFAFRIGDNLLYVPVFFLNGEIKGTDLLYRHDSKTFVPLEDQWVKFLINKASRHMGKGIDTSQHVSPKDINLDELAYPPGMQTTGGGSVKVSSDHSKGSYLKKFIIEDGGYEAIRKLASMMDSNYEFAKAFSDNIPQDCFMPSELHVKVASLVKEAAAAMPKPNFMLSIGGIDQLSGIPIDQVEKAAEQMSKQGYNLWDDRDSGDAKVTKPVYTDAEKELTEVGEEPGYWDVLMYDGSTEKAFVARDSDNSFNSGSNEFPCDSYEDSGPSRKLIIFKNGDCRRSSYGEQVYGEKSGEEWETQSVAFEDLPKTMTSGTTYRVFDAEGGTLSDVIKCTGTLTKGGIEYYTACKSWGDPFMITKNPDASRIDIGQNLLNDNAYFIKVTSKACKSRDRGNFDTCNADKHLGTGNTLRAWCTDTGVKEASLTYKEGSFQLRHSFGDQTRYVSRPTMAIKLACQMEIHADTVEEMLDSAQESGVLNFMYGNPGDAYSTAKSAAMTRLSEQPNFQMYQDDDFDVDMDMPQQYILGSETRQDDIPAQQIGDAFDPSMGMGGQPQEDGEGLPMEQLMSYSPEQLAQVAQGDQVPQIFEHGVVGSLVQTFDAVSMIDKYIPDMEQALDKLGRLLFLFYWKPRDFENAYGVDDMSNMENQILSNFRSFGELTLELLKKAETMRKGTVSLAGE